MKVNFTFFKMVFILWAFLIFFNGTQDNAVIEQVHSIISAVKQEYYPDSRVSIFNITVDARQDTFILNGEVSSIEAKHKLFEKLGSFEDYMVKDHIIVLPHPDLKGNTYGIIRISTAQVRRHPEIESELISQATMGAEVRILKNKGWWYQCQMEDGYLGWIMRSSLITGDESFIENWKQKDKMIMIENYSQVRQEPKDKSLPVSDLVRGNKIIFLKKHRKWIEVELPDGRNGFIKKEFVVKEKDILKNSNVTADAIIRTAMSFIGTPYLWGGTSIKGFDCSGFTQSVFKYNGIKLPRDANMQVNVGEEVPLSDNLMHLKAGDLLFWGPGDGRITHVGIYIGNLRFIHSDGMVRINSFNPEHEDYNEYRHKNLRRAKRILMGEKR